MTLTILLFFTPLVNNINNRRYMIMPTANLDLKFLSESVIVD